MEYLFKTHARMKEYNRNNYWIDDDIIEELFISAENLDFALEKYAEKVNKEHCCTISQNALKNKEPIYRDYVDGTKQVGYCITACMDFDKGNYTGWSKQYFDLWIDIYVVSIPTFKEEEV